MLDRVAASLLGVPDEGDAMQLEGDIHRNKLRTTYLRCQYAQLCDPPAAEEIRVPSSAVRAVATWFPLGLV
jgi:hypothetical protein